MSKITPNLGLVLLANTKNNKTSATPDLTARSNKNKQNNNKQNTTIKQQQTKNYNQTTVKRQSETGKVKTVKAASPNQNTDCANEKLDLET